MTETLILDINMELVRQRLNQTANLYLSSSDIADWLQTKGFRSSNDGWVCDDAALGQLENAEYRIIHEL